MTGLAKFDFDASADRKAEGDPLFTKNILRIALGCVETDRSARRLIRKQFTQAKILSGREACDRLGFPVIDAHHVLECGIPGATDVFARELHAPILLLLHQGRVLPATYHFCHFCVRL